MTGALVAATSPVAAQVAWEGGVTAVFQGADDPGVESELTASADLFARLPTASGEWLIYVEASSSPRENGVSEHYPTANADARTVLTRDGNGDIQISELNYTFRLPDNQSLMVGLIDPSAWLDRGRIANDENQHFLNGSFVNNATIEFPDYAIGAVYRALANGARPEMTLVVSGSDGIADTPDRSYQELLDLTGDGHGVFAGFGANWLGDKTSMRAGAWYRSDDHAVLDTPTESQDNYGAYAVFDWLSGNDALHLRAGIANEDVSMASRFLAVAYERRLPVGFAGVGVARTLTAGGTSRNGFDDGLDVELFYRFPVFARHGHLTPSIQYIENPGFDASGPAAPSAAVVAGMRLRWSFGT